MNLMMAVGRVFDRILLTLAYVAGGLLIAAWLIVNYDVSMRWFFNMPLRHALEIVEFTLLIITFLSTAWVLKVEGHTSIDLLVVLFGRRTQIIITRITSLVSAGVCLLIFWWSAQTTWFHFQTHYGIQYTTLRFPFWYVEWVIPFGTFLLFIQFLRRAYRWQPKSQEVLLEERVRLGLD